MAVILTGIFESGPNFGSKCGQFQAGGGLRYIYFRQENQVVITSLTYKLKCGTIRIWYLRNKDRCGHQDFHRQGFFYIFNASTVHLRFRFNFRKYFIRLLIIIQGWLSMHLKDYTPETPGTAVLWAMNHDMAFSQTTSWPVGLLYKIYLVDNPL